MTRDEVKVLFRIMDSVYPHAYKNDEQLSDAMDVWAVVFAGDKAKLVESALYTYINDDNEYAPTPGQIRAIMRRIMNPDELSEGDAWNMVRRALSNGLYGAQEEFDKLPKDVQKAVGSPQWIHSVAMDEDANMSVESSNFYRRYRKVIEDKKQLECMPPAVQRIIGELADKTSVSEVAMLEDRRAASAFEYEERRQKAIDEFLKPSEEPMSEQTITSIEMLKERLSDGRFNDKNT